MSHIVSEIIRPYCLPGQAPCGTPWLLSRTSCGWAAACSPWSCDTASPPCCRELRLPPLRLQCSHLRRRRWPRPRCSGSRGGVDGGYLCGGCSLLDSHWPQHIKSQPTPAKPGGWPTLCRRLLWCCHLKHDQKNDYPHSLLLCGEVFQIVKTHWCDNQLCLYGKVGARISTAGFVQYFKITLWLFGPFAIQHYVLV